MTVDELIKELQKLSQEGHGKLPVLYKAYYFEEVHWATIEGEGEEGDNYILLDTTI